MRGSTPRRGASQSSVMKGSCMSRFTKTNFKRIIKEIEDAESRGDNFWIPVGILEVMYDDDYGWIDEHFHTESLYRNVDKLWDKLQKNFDK